jgi:OOP family OmpA-OmpF porin
VEQKPAVEQKPVVEQKPQPVVEKKAEPVMKTSAVAEKKPEPVVEQKAEPKEVKVYFRFNSSRIQTSEVSKIDELAEYMKANADKKLTVTGYASRDGKWQYNLKLSRWRANAVKKALVARGIDGKRIKVVAKGEKRGPKKETRAAVAITIE